MRNSKFSDFKSIFDNSIKVKATKIATHPTRLGADILSVCKKTALESASDIMQFRSGKITKGECIARVSENAGGAIGSLVCGRVAMVVGAAMLPSLGGVALLGLSVAGGYIGTHIGKGIVNGTLFKDKDSKALTLDRILNQAKEIKTLKRI